MSIWPEYLEKRYLCARKILVINSVALFPVTSQLILFRKAEMMLSQGGSVEAMRCRGFLLGS